jgi:hypothetical protein
MPTYFIPILYMFRTYIYWFQLYMKVKCRAQFSTTKEDTGCFYHKN